MPAPTRRKTNGGKLAALHAAAPEKQPMNWIPLDRYFRSATLLERQAEAYRRTNNPEQLYVILLRFANLSLKTIPRHSGYNGNTPEALQLRRRCRSAVAELEALQGELQKRESLEFLEKKPFKPSRIPSEAVKLSAGHVPGLHWAGAEEKAAASNAALNAEFGNALEDLGRPDWTPDGKRDEIQKGEMVLGNNRIQSGLQIPDLTPSIVLPKASDETLSKHVIMPLDSNAGYSHNGDTNQLTNDSNPLEQKLPTYSALLSSLQMGNPPVVKIPGPYSGQLQLGPQEMGVYSSPYPSGPPPPGATCSHETADGGGIMKDNSASQSATVLSEVKARKSMRDVHVSKGLMDQFLQFAAQNTRKSIETCGILAGSLSPDDSRFTVTALIVPKQEGTTDTVQALSEEEIFEVQDSRALYPLGWIHTHPSQSCFLSSVDVHTHCGYQTMLDEAIAIVMAPTDARTPVGIFRLTTPGGLQLIQKCPLRGFHPHGQTETGQDLYELCGHVYLNPRVDFEVIDLRK